MLRGLISFYVAFYGSGDIWLALCFVNEAICLCSGRFDNMREVLDPVQNPQWIQGFDRTDRPGGVQTPGGGGNQPLKVRNATLDVSTPTWVMFWTQVGDMEGPTSGMDPQKGPNPGRDPVLEADDHALGLGDLTHWKGSNP